MVQRDLATPDGDDEPKTKTTDMSRQKKGQSPVHGWVILDKPPGITSTQAVAAVRRIFDAQKAGHAGTLDPLATGILAIALGEATKTVPYARMRRRSIASPPAGAKPRQRRCRRQGHRHLRCAPRPRGQIEAMLPRFTGTLTQIPPAYSAIKVEGERAYDLAREGEEVILEPRPVQVYRGPAAGDARSGPCRVRNPLWQRDLRPVLGARYGPGAGHFGPCFGQLRRTRVGGLSGKRRGRRWKP